ncbi:restriction endonuclease subunit S [Lactococcus formosensis]|uniref:restriction endonuclease subunit S n=1 Tax=Lactococcus formosensis TaxID=1281486 RepID=UPI003857A5E6
MSKKGPQLRFEGFTDDWEERKIKDIFKITRGQVLAATETSEKKSDISPFPVYSSQTKNNGLMGYYKDYLFDTAITWTTDGANAGTVSYRSGRFYSTNVNGVLISDKGYTNKAISEILNLEAWKWVSHVGNPKLMNNVMGDISIMIPSSFEEQDRLSDFLNQLDDTIALHQHKLDLLKEQKKGYLQKMFPKNGAKVPELRFAGFADDWEERKLGDEVKINGRIGFRGYTQADIVTKETGVLAYSPTNIVNNRLYRKQSDTYITKQKYRESPEIMVKNSDILFVKTGSTLGKSALVQGINYHATVNPQIVIIRSNELDEYFLSVILTSYNILKRINTIKIGGAIPTMTETELKKFPIQVPKSTEQKKIGSFFKQLDNTIALHQRKLDLLKEQKKGFLQKMFV